jgi:hypothetical protein
MGPLSVAALKHRIAVPDPTIRSEPRLEGANNLRERNGALHECMQSSPHIVLDTADIVRDGDFSPTEGWHQVERGRFKPNGQREEVG